MIALGRTSLAIASRFNEQLAQSKNKLTVREILVGKRAPLPGINCQEQTRGLLLDHI
jgi:hypothetical protein